MMMRVWIRPVGATCTLLAFAACGMGRQPGDETKHVYALIVADTDAAEAPTLGIAVDGRRVLSLLDETFQIPDKGKRSDRISLAVLSGRDVTPSNIKAYYASLPKDLSANAVFFYYSGHGGSVQDADNSRYLAMRRGVVWRKELKTWIASHKPRLSVVLTDCCSNFDGEDTSEASKAAKGEGHMFKERKPGQGGKPDDTDKPSAPDDSNTGAEKWSAATARSRQLLDKVKGVERPKVCWPQIKSLLFYNAGEADVTAALPGDFATGVRENGGRFTRTLISQLETGYVASWFDVTSDVQAKTQLQTGAYEQGGLTVIPRKGPLGAPDLGLGIETSDNTLTSVKTTPFGLGIELWDTRDFPKKAVFTGLALKYPGRLSVRSVELDLPAEKAGLQFKDCILKIDGKRVQSPCEFFEALRGKKQVEVEYAREVESETNKWEDHKTVMRLPEDDGF